MFAKNESLIQRIEVLRPLPPNLNPFDGPAVFLSNGLKAMAAREKGIPTYTSPALAAAMDEAERICHVQYRPSAGVGPHSINDIPYALVTALAKGAPAREIMWQEGHRGGYGVVSDVVIELDQPGVHHTTTAHKLTNEKERAALAGLLIGGQGHMRIVSNAGLYRFSLDDLKSPGELFYIRVDHGALRRDPSTTVLSKQLVANTGTPANLRSPFILENLVEPLRLLDVTVKKYVEKKPEINNQRRGFIVLEDASGGGGEPPSIEPNDDKGAQYTISSANPREVEIQALGFV